MSMRVPNLMNNTQSLLDLQRIKQQLAQLTMQVSSGQRIINLGDDPAGTAQIMGYQASISLNAQYVAQGDQANAQLQAASSALDTMGSTITRLLVLAQEGMAANTTTGSQAAIAAEVDGLRTDLISLGNTQVNGRYIFAGTNTLTQPFQDNVPATATSPQSVTYNGNNSIINLTIGTSVNMAVNIPGDTLFFGGPQASAQGSATDLLAQVTALRDALQANDPAAIQTAYSNLRAINDRLNVSVADLGARANGVSSLQSGLTSFNNTLTTLQSSVASVDYPTAITQLNQAYVAQDATLSVMSKSNAKNLFDYLG